MQNGSEPGKGAAVGSLVLGIISLCLSFASYAAIAAVILGIVGIVLASMSKKAGYQGGMRTAGMVLSIIGLILGAIVFVACAACTGCLCALG